ncbi:MAG: hypothetical protein PHS82_03265 [Lachnospiraceae bacterium]|nr:hypothetical protein [Lachnospiraceae bacterium]
MKRSRRIENVCCTVESLKDSISRYDDADEKKNTTCGYGPISNVDSRSSIIRRCMVAREELLQIMKSLED